MAGFDVSGVLGNVGRQLTNQVGGAAARTGAGAVGGIVKGLFNAGADAVGGLVKSGAQEVNFSRLPDQIDLAQSRSLAAYVDKSLALLGGKNTVDGKMGPAELDQINQLRQKSGNDELLRSPSDFTTKDMKLIVSAMEEKAESGKADRRNGANVNMLNTHLEGFGAAVDKGLKELPKPPEPAPTAAQDKGFTFGGGG